MYKNARTRSEIFSKLTIKTPEQRHWRHIETRKRKFLLYRNQSIDLQSKPIDWFNMKTSEISEIS